MLVGVLIGRFIPAIPDILGRLEISGISIPIAILIWVMIYPMMMKVEFRSVKQVGKNPKGLFLTWIVNWLIKPFTMYGIAALFLFVVFKGFISPDLATEYLAGRGDPFKARSHCTDCGTAHHPDFSDFLYRVWSG